MKTKFLLSVIIGISVMSFAFAPDKKTWSAPAAAASKTNPQKGPEAIANGKSLYARNCQSCHGKSGLGDGTKAAQLKTEPGDFSKATFQSQTDGTIFYKITEGRDDMPGFKKKMPEANDVWDVISYLKTLKK